VSPLHLNHYLIVSSLLFALGAFGVLTRRNAVGVLLGIELMLNAANLNLVAFWRYLTPQRYSPQVFVLIIITLAAAEAAVGLGIILNVYRRFKTIDVDYVSVMKG
jgi:NADH-quinone oxidoreductase subunit K